MYENEIDINSRNSKVHILPNKKIISINTELNEVDINSKNSKLQILPKKKNSDDNNSNSGANIESGIILYYFNINQTKLLDFMRLVSKYTFLRIYFNNYNIRNYFILKNIR